ncbi:IS66-like element accessory protein TnpA [Pelagibacterium sediminicola]|uniref:IS66-like element accessory protein TnpA n=1 Tax=Pelagibacterium sediminicola TaxID=2248761 RepID=UPI000E310186|nr:transposase [Pelagibacterium sediminicola]NMA96534.1 transposase [Phyllobacteriaceae bacterium]
MSYAKTNSHIEILGSEDLGRRREWTDEEKVRIVQESLRGHRQGSATARRYGLSRSLLSIWRRDYRRGVLGGPAGHAFMPLAISAREAAPVEPPMLSGSGPDVRIEIALPNGRRLTVPATLDPGILARLLPVVDPS